MPIILKITEGEGKDLMCSSCSTLLSIDAEWLLKITSLNSEDQIVNGNQIVGYFKNV